MAPSFGQQSKNRRVSPPEGLIAEVRRNSNYPLAEWRELLTSEPLDPHVVTTRLRAALDEAEAFVTRMPDDKLGLLFLKEGHIVQPDSEHLEIYQTHAGQRRGHWPTSAEITAEMLAIALNRSNTFMY